jgi:branched-chain amino acid transport system substrate-binding protein
VAVSARARSLAVAGLLGAAAAAGCADVINIPDDRFVTGASGTADGRCVGTISVRVLADYTGAIKAVATPYVKGEIDYLRELNETGGIRGCSLDIDVQDYGYDVNRAQAIYDAWRARPDWPQVAAVFAGGTADTLQLAPQAQADQKPLLSGSYFGALASPRPINFQVNVPEVGLDFRESVFPTQVESPGYPYCFFVGTDYSTGGRVAVFHVKSQGGKRMGFFRCSNNVYCTGPLAALRSYAKELELPIGRDLIVEMGGQQAAYDASVLEYFQQEKARREADPTYEMVDWVWLGNTTPDTATLARALGAANAALGLNVQIIVNNWAMDEALPVLCGSACADFVHGIMPFTAFGDTSRGSTEMPKVVALHDKWRQRDYDEAAAAGAPDAKLESHRNVRYVQGYVNALVFRIAAERVLDLGLPVNGENVKNALETFDDVDTGGLTDRLSFSPDDHRPQSSESIYKLSAEGKLVREPYDRTIARQTIWLGW